MVPATPTAVSAACEEGQPVWGRSPTSPSALPPRRQPAGRVGDALRRCSDSLQSDPLDFEFSEDQELLRATVRRFLAERAPVAYVRSMLDDERGATDEIWSGLAELGVTGLLVPEAQGGAGMGMVDMAVVREELGRAVHPGPFASSAVGAVSLVTLAGSADDRAGLLAGLASGESVGTVALAEPERTRATHTGGEWTITGRKVHVPDGIAADVVFVTAVTGDGELGAFVVARD